MRQSEKKGGQNEPILIRSDRRGTLLLRIHVHHRGYDSMRRAWLNRPKESVRQRLTRNARTAIKWSLAVLFLVWVALTLGSLIAMAQGTNAPWDGQLSVKECKWVVAEARKSGKIL